MKKSYFIDPQYFNEKEKRTDGIKSEKLKMYVSEILDCYPQFLWFLLPTKEKDWKIFQKLDEELLTRNIEIHKILKFQRLHGLKLDVSRNLFQAWMDWDSEIREEIVREFIRKKKENELKESINKVKWEGDKNYKENKDDKFDL